MIFIYLLILSFLIYFVYCNDELNKFNYEREGHLIVFKNENEQDKRNVDAENCLAVTNEALKQFTFSTEEIDVSPEAILHIDSTFNKKLLEFLKQFAKTTFEELYDLFDDVDLKKNTHLWLLSKASFDAFGQSPDIKLPFTDGIAGVFFCEDSETLNVAIHDGFFQNADPALNIDGIVGFGAFDTLRTFTHEEVHALQREAKFYAIDDGYYWIEGSANLIAEQIASKVVNVPIDHFTNALYPSAMRQKCGKLGSFADLNSYKTFYGDNSLVSSRYALAHAATIMASHYCGDDDDPATDAVEFMVQVGEGKSLNAAFNSVYSCSRSSFESNVDAWLAEYFDVEAVQPRLAMSVDDPINTIAFERSSFDGDAVRAAAYVDFKTPSTVEYSFNYENNDGTSIPESLPLTDVEVTKPSRFVNRWNKNFGCETNDFLQIASQIFSNEENIARFEMVAIGGVVRHTRILIFDKTSKLHSIPRLNAIELEESFEIGDEKAYGPKLNVLDINVQFGNVGYKPEPLPDACRVWFCWPSWFFVFLLFFGLFCLFYWVIGCLVNKFARKRTGTDIIPNKNSWRRLFGLCCKCCRPNQSKSSTPPVVQQVPFEPNVTTTSSISSPSMVEEGVLNPETFETPPALPPKKKPVDADALMTKIDELSSDSEL